jgi:hypothetical protein
VYEFQSLALNNQMDDGKIGITSAALNATDYRILEGDEDSYSIVPSKLNEGQSVLTLSEDAEVTMQLVYMIPFGEESILYQPCLNLTTNDPNSGEVGSGTYVFFDYAAVSLDLNRYESEYPLNVSESSAQSAKADVTIQSRDAADGKAEDGLLNYEIAGLETENGLSVADERLSSGDIIYDGLFGYDGNINQSDTYTAFENVTGRLYDTMSELPQYFADSNALKKICEKYTEQGGYAEENLKFLTVQFEYTYYSERTDGLTIHNLQKIWLYDQKEDGLFYPYGYPDDYQILSAQTDGNTEHSPYLYLKNGESAVVEVVYVIPADSYQKLYVTPADRLLWQESVDGLCTTFSCVLAKDTEF